MPQDAEQLSLVSDVHCKTRCTDKRDKIRLLGVHYLRLLTPHRYRCRKTHDLWRGSVVMVLWPPPLRLLAPAWKHINLPLCVHFVSTLWEHDAEIPGVAFSQT
jgi:hypothetical protein